MSNAVVYLAGKMTGLTVKEMSEWRNKATELLWERFGISTLNPVNTDFGENCADQEIIHSNDYMIKHSDLLLVELDWESEFSIGTVAEIVEARRQGKPIIVWGTAYGIINHPHIRGRFTRHFEKLEDAINYIGKNYKKA